VHARVAGGRARKGWPAPRIFWCGKTAFWERGAASCAFDVRARYSKRMIYTHKTVKCYLNKGQMQSADKGLCVRGASRELKEGAARSLQSATSSSLLPCALRTYMDFQSISDSRALVTKSAALAFPAAARGRTLHIAHSVKNQTPPPSALAAARLR
jgi:hypothetical protein